MTSVLMVPAVGALTYLEAFIGPLQLCAVYFNLSSAVPALAGSAWFSGGAPQGEVHWLAALALAGPISSAGAASMAARDVQATFAAQRVAFCVAWCEACCKWIRTVPNRGR